MTIMRSLRSAALGMALLVSASALALAQTAGTPALPTPSAKTANPAAGAALARVEARIKQLHAQLQITPAEEPQWGQFAETMRTNAREMDEAATQRTEKFSSMSAVQGMQSYEQLAEAHVQHLQKLIPAFEALYNAMPAPQQQLADQVFRAGAERRAQTGSSR
jgi:periplasmic protein CpxP/Spy